MSVKADEAAVDSPSQATAIAAAPVAEAEVLSWSLLVARNKPFKEPVAAAITTCRRGSQQQEEPELTVAVKPDEPFALVPPENPSPKNVIRRWMDAWM
ncbi:hypothetical protein pipiens_016881 [Culex pipiens pipiens]|uniref:Uncharacterized protein n=1 Tax=Culex pipiens pipiens TaxID=38569 RepID=A0ABD1CJ87_CULPP